MPKLSKKNELDEVSVLTIKNRSKSSKGSKKVKTSKGSKKVKTSKGSKKVKTSKGHKRGPKINKQNAGSYVGHNPVINRSEKDEQKCAPGVKFEEFTPAVVDPALPTRLSRNDVAFITFQVLLEVKFPSAADMSVAIILL
jgi:hypothetical protein